MIAQDMISQDVLGIITIIMVFAIYAPYLLQTLKKQIKPHPYSWLIWTIITGVAYAAQLSDNAGAGAWMNGPLFIISGLIAFYAFRHSASNIKPIDKISLLSSLLTIPIWIITEDALWSVIIASLLNAIASIPTFRKSYAKPFEEAGYMYGFNFIRHTLSIIAMANISWVTCLFPLALALNNGTFFIYLMWRRSIIKRQM